MQHFSVRERLGVAAAAGIVLMLGLGGWAYSRVGGGAEAPKPAFAPVGAEGAPASIEIAAGGAAPASGKPGASAAGAGATPAVSAVSMVLVVHVTGEVRNPGVYKFKQGDRIADAIHAAGGFKDHADQEALNLADTLRDADQICVPLLVKLTGPDNTAESRSTTVFSSGPATRRRSHPLIVRGASPAEVAPAPVVIDPSPAAPIAAAEDAPTAAVPPVVMQRAPGRVLGKPALVYNAADETSDEAAGTDSNIGADGAAAVVPEAGMVRVSVSKKGRAAAGARASKGSKGSGKSGKFKNPGDGIVHINSATAAQFEQLPGVGPAMSGRIVEYRAQIGKFTDISQMMDVKGIGEKKFAKMQPFLAL